MHLKAQTLVNSVVCHQFMLQLSLTAPINLLRPLPLTRCMSLSIDSCIGRNSQDDIGSGGVRVKLKPQSEGRILLKLNRLCDSDDLLPITNYFQAE